jgi:hypothetical protein
MHDNTSNLIMTTLKLLVLTQVPLPQAVSLASPHPLSFGIQEQLLLQQQLLACGAPPPAQPSTLFLGQLEGLQDTHHPTFDILGVTYSSHNILNNNYNNNTWYLLLP